MSYIENWTALSDRIKGLRKAGDLFARFQGYHQEDNYGAGNYLREQCGSVVSELESFRTEFLGSLPNAALQRLDEFLASTLAGAARHANTQGRGARGALVALSGLEAEITFILSGRQEIIRARSERAFLLLQRQLAVDEQVRMKWLKAIDQGEPDCEALGSIHLLSQGVYAFKVNAEGARTDLLFAEPPDEPLLVRSVDGLVLTEWKVATDTDAIQKFGEAKTQAELYKSGPLAGAELTSYRYLVAVSRNELSNIPADETNAEDSVTKGWVKARYVRDSDCPMKTI